ncbi:MAG: adenosylcobinamide-GDP ribazoletransferase, partial [Beijerinckiaceae bacterium]
IVTTGAFHEDGLADVADGFGGGTTIARKLEIMKDSRVGAFGAVAACLSILLRVVAIGALIEARPPGSVAAVLVATAILSRLAGLIPLAMLPPARGDGASAQFGRPGRAEMIAGFAIAAALIAAATMLAGWPSALAPAMFGSAIVAGLLVTWLSARQIQGHTGDVAGAAQQVAEIACLITPLAATFAQ